MADVDSASISAGSDALPRPFGARYVLVDRIGVGGMAEIFLARGRTQSGVGRLAVVKLVLPKFAQDERFSAMLVQEAKLAAQLSHGNVVQTFDLGREDGRLYIAMEYVEGFDLNELLKRCSKAKVPLPFEYALLIVRETLQALDYAHRKKDSEGKPLGVVHRDVSPSNVLISFEGEVKLCDFGIARALNTRDSAGEAIEGKANYMAPEHARGDTVDARADVFSASVILWELIAGRRMYRPTPGADLLALARAGDAPELPEKDLPGFDKLRAIVRKGLAKSPADRYPNAVTMLRELDDYAMELGLHATPMALGEFVVEHFGQEILELRRAREQAAIAMEVAQPEITNTKQTVAPPAEAWDDSTAVERIAAADSPVTLPAAPSTARATSIAPPGDGYATGQENNWPTVFPPLPLPSQLPPPLNAPPDAIQSWSPAPEEQSSTAGRLLALVLGAVITIAIGALILSRLRG
jgi:serine/threonine protein kinase